MRRIALAFVVACGAVVTLSAFQLKPETLAAWERYIQLDDAVLAERRVSSAPFLWIDRQPEDDRREHMTDLERAEVVIEELKDEVRDENGNKVDVKSGRIHHWVGTVFVPGATLDEVVAFVQNYDKYGERFAPDIESAEVLSRDGDHWVVKIRTMTTKMTITRVYVADYVVDYRRVSPTRLETMNRVTNIFEVKDAGKPDERLVPADSEEASGYLWRLRLVCRFEQRAEGTYEECESVTLTRRPPKFTGWIVNRFINALSRETIENNLSVVRDGVGKPGSRPCDIARRARVRLFGPPPARPRRSAAQTT